MKTGIVKIMNNKLVLDTHILLWVLLEPDQLSKEIKKQIEIAQKEGNLIISSISLWEVAMLSSKKRINIYENIGDFLKSISIINGLIINDISAEIASESVLLMDGFHGDPADRMIVATTKVNAATLLTRDKKILAWSKFGHIKCLEA